MSYAIFRCDGVKSLSDLTNRGKHNKGEKESYKTNSDIRIEDSIWLWYLFRTNGLFKTSKWCS